MAANVKNYRLNHKSWIFYIITFLLCLILSKAAKLTVPRILLPYNTGVPTNYTLEVKEGGCYKWSSSRSDLVSVIPIPLERERPTCTTKALVSAVSRYPERENAIILAEDERSGQILRCDVVIDSLHAIEIVTTTRVLFLEDAPEVFEVIAKNDQGDTFSSLAGIAFQWSLESDTRTSDVRGVLRFLKFADSVYKTPPAVEYWEKQNLHGSMILMEGSKTGSAKVIVKPMNDAYRNVSSYEVSLVIVANLNLKPSHIYLLPGTKIRYRLELIKQGKAFPITLPSDQYYLEVTDKSIATLDPNTSTVTTHVHGSTTITVKDRYLTGHEISHLPSAMIHVTSPSYLTFSVSPGDKWSLEEMKDYSVSVRIYDINSYPIYITENVKVSVQFPPKFFETKSSVLNGTFHEVQTLIPGSCQISGQLIGVTLKDGRLQKFEPTVVAHQDVIIYENIKVLPKFNFLPWNVVTKPMYSIYLMATGGTGSFNWNTNDTALGTVVPIQNREQKGQVTTFGQGAFLVRATDVNIPLFTGISEVSVQPVSAMQLLPTKVETELNGSVVLPVAMYGYHPDRKEKVLFNNCSEVPITVEIDDMQKFMHSDDDGAPIRPSACRNVYLKCIIKGFSRVIVSYVKEGGSLRGSVIVGCHRKLKVVYPMKESVIAMGSTANIVFEGGPKMWPLCKDGHYVNTSPPIFFADVNVQRNESDSSDIHKVKAFCRTFGEDTFTLTVKNQPCASNLFPAINEASVRIACAAPDTIILKPVLPSLPEKKCPVPADNMIAIHSSQSLEIELIVKDALGREFQNLSSFDIKWFFSKSDLAYFAVNEGFMVKHSETHGTQIETEFYQEIHPYGFEGNLKVTVSIIGYRPEAVNGLDLLAEHAIATPINSSLNFVLVEEAEVRPKKASIFNSPSNKVYLNITKGSGHFHVESSDPRKAVVNYKEATRQIEIIPLETGSLRISVTDLCMGLHHEDVSVIHIYGISAIIVDVLDKVQEGKSILASVEVLNEDNQKIPSSMFGLMGLQSVSASNIISIKLASAFEPQNFYVLFSITGLTLGQTNFKIVTSGNMFKGKQYSSDTHQIQVFPPLKLNPDSIRLIIGSTFQVFCTGGPQPQTGIEYHIIDKDIADVTVAGVVEAKKIGKTRLQAKSVGHDKKGNGVVFSEDSIEIWCIELTEIKIHSPLSRMIAGSEMPLYAMGLSDQETPFTFGTAVPSAKFRWTISNDKVATLYNLYSSVGLQEIEENNFRVGIRAQQDGLVTVHLEMTLPETSTHLFSSGPRVLSSEVQIQVFKKLKLINPEVEDGMILLSHNSELKLQCNRGGTVKVSYAILQQDRVSSQSPVVTVDDHGVLTAYSKSGSCILSVTSVEEFGVIQHLSVTVKVAEIAYMMVKPRAEIRTRDWPLTVLPVGFSVPFIVTYHNSIGQKFDAVRSQLKFRANRYNLARISFGSNNNTLVVQVVKPGYTVLKVWDLESSISPDYLKIVAGSVVDPTDTHLTVGDVVCFGSPLLTREGHSGTWSSDSHILSVHAVSGGAVALSPGTTAVTYSLMNGFSTATQVTVQAAAYISIISTGITHVSNVPRAKPYKIPIVVQSNETHRVNNLIGKNCTYATESSMPLPFVQPPFSCELNFVGSSADVSASEIFHSLSGFDIEKGTYFCSIEPASNIPLNEASIIEGQLSLSVHLLASDHTSSLSEQHLFVFLPAFHVEQDEIVLSDIQDSSVVTISATPSVQRCINVVPSDLGILRVDSPSMNIAFPPSITFHIELKDLSHLWHGDFTSLYIDINCPITKQHVRVPIRLKRVEAPMDGVHCLTQHLPSPNSSYSSYDWYWITTVMAATVAIFIVFYFMRWLFSSRRGVVTTQPVFLNTSNGSHNLSAGLYTPYTRRFSPSPDYDSLSQPLRMCTLETPPRTLHRRQTDNVFR